jgi:hypothetical protein
MTVLHLLCVLAGTPNLPAEWSTRQTWRGLNGETTVVELCSRPTADGEPIPMPPCAQRWWLDVDGCRSR